MEGKETRPNKKLVLIIIPIPRLKRREGKIIKSDSVNRTFLIELTFDPIARIIKKSFDFSMIPAF